MADENEKNEFFLRDFTVESGESFQNARLVWKTYGTLSPSKDNVIVYPTSFAAQDIDIEWLIGPERVLDSSRWFIVIPNMFGNGLSSSPSHKNGYPSLVTAADNVRAQKRLLEEQFGIDRVKCVYGWSMGAQQAYHWATVFPDAVESIVVNCGSARTSQHNKVFVQGMMAILEAAPEYVGNGRFSSRPEAALRAFGRVYAGWALSQEFYREKKYIGIGGAQSLEDYIASNWNGRFAARHGSDLHAHLNTWFHGDISANAQFGGDLAAALSSIKCRVLLMPGETDLYFRVADNELELKHLRKGHLTPIPSVWGHLAGNPRQNPADAEFLRERVRDWLAA
jgi:homoserine O-acetyltransferase